MRRRYTFRIAMNFLISLFIPAFALAPVFSSAEEPRSARYEELAVELTKGADRTEGDIIQKGETLTVGRCIDIALRKNPSRLAAENTVDASFSRVGQAQANYYPQLNWSSSYDRIHPASGRTTSFFGASGREQAFDEYASSLSLSQLIYDFGKTSSSVNIQKYNLASSRSDLDATTDQIIFNVKQAYYGLLRSKRNRDAAEDIVKQLQLRLDQAKGFYEVGIRAKIDVTRAEADLSTAKLGLIQAENAIKIAWVTLNNAMGVPDAPLYTIEDNLAFQKFEITFEDALGRAYEYRPDLKALTARREASGEAIRFAKTGYYPAISGNASYNWAGEELSNIEDGWSAGVTLTFPLFSGFLTKNQVAEAKSNFSALKANEQSLRQQILLDVQQAYLNLHEAQESISTAEIGLRSAQENLDLANGRYAAGVGSPIEVSDAFATYANAQVAYTGALYNYKIAQATVEKAMGIR
ncbi:MAG: TolC family protein [bacterium]